MTQTMTLKEWWRQKKECERREAHRRHDSNRDSYDSNTSSPTITSTYDPPSISNWSPSSSPDPSPSIDPGGGSSGGGGASGDW